MKNKKISSNKAFIISMIVYIILIGSLLLLKDLII